MSDVTRVGPLVVAAFVLGFALAAVLAPRSAPRAAAPPTASPSVESRAGDVDDARVFAQPLVAACGVGGEAYAVSRGGGLAHFDGRRWRLVDDTLRDLNAVACGAEVVVAVGDGGRLVRVDALRREIFSDTVADVDLYAVAVTDAGTIFAAGGGQIVLRFSGGRWERLGRGQTAAAWRAVHVARASEVWLAGDGGALFEFDGRTFLDRSLPDPADLTALGARGSGPFVGTADGRAYAVARDPSAPGSPPRIEGGEVRFGGPVRAIFSPDPRTVYWLADGLWRIAQIGGLIRVDAGLSCPPRAMFETDGTLWVLASQGNRAAFARSDLTGQRWRTLGSC